MTEYQKSKKISLNEQNSDRKKKTQDKKPGIWHLEDTFLDTSRITEEDVFLVIDDSRRAAYG